MGVQSWTDSVRLALAGFIVTTAIRREWTAGKLITLGPFTPGIAVICWPAVFIAPDLIKQCFGRAGVKRSTRIGIGLIVYAFFVLNLSRFVPGAAFSAVTAAQFQAIFSQSLWVIIGGVVATALSQLVDVFIIWPVRHKTGYGLRAGRLNWSQSAPNVHECKRLCYG